MRELCGMQVKTDRSSLKMRVTTSIFIAAMLVLFVYCLSAGAVFTSGIEYIDKNRNQKSENSLWTYICENESTCTRKKLAEGQERVSLETCNTMCATLQLWPKPTHVEINNKSSSTFNKNQVTIELLRAVDKVKDDLNTAAKIFMNNLPDVGESWIKDVDITSLRIQIIVNGSDTKLNMSTDESYGVSIINIENTVFAIVSAPTYFGARHGLETLSQLIWLDPVAKKLRIVHDVKIFDKPKFPYRGLMVDTARNYFPLRLLKKVVDGMAATKLNVVHLHVTDAVSFPIILPNNRIFAEYGAYSEEMVYTPDDILDLIEYSRVRGIRVVLEIDAPSHANEGWNQVAEDLVICGKDDVYNGHLNPENNKTLGILKSIYKDLLQLGTDNEIFHIGGDEVNLTCWSETLFKGKKLDLHEYWANFTNKIFHTVKSANNNKLPKHIVIWSSPLTNSYLNSLKYKSNVVVQYWYGSVEPILTSGHKVIFSTVGRWYLDCGFGPWKPSMTNGVCDPYTPWQTFYKYRPWQEYSDYAGQFLGGEACLWSEQVEVDSLETRIWPRAAAFAERLWSDLDGFDNYDVYTRLDVHRNRLNQRGIKTAAMWPRWCSQNPGKC